MYEGIGLAIIICIILIILHMISFENRMVEIFLFCYFVFLIVSIIIIKLFTY